MTDAGMIVRRIGPVAVTSGALDEAVATLLDAVDRHRPATFTFANAHSINLARRQPGFAAALAGMTVFNDGIGVDLASRMIHGVPFDANLNGTDLTPALLGGLREPTPVFLLGSPAGVADRAAAVLADRFPHFRLAGTHHGFFDAAGAAAIAERIAASGARLVLVGMGQPRQEQWAAAWGPRLSATVCCVGAFLDFAAGAVPRAPDWVRAARLEWAFRLACEPRRLAGRYLIGNATFLAAMARIALRRRLGRSNDDAG